MIRKASLALAAMLALTGMQAPPRPALSMWRLDCGTIQVSDLNVFSDTFAYVGQRKTLTDSCYLIRNGDRYLLWDTGLPAEARGAASGPFTMTAGRRIVDQLREIGIAASQVTFVGISHNHGDHLGQAADFPGATLIIGKEDYDATVAGAEAKRLAPWTAKGTTGGAITFVLRDHDVFGDGSVTVLDMPGHTAGHQALLVRLRSGPVLLSGDQFHFEENRRGRGVPSFNADRSDTLGSHDRFEAIARNLRAKVIIQHEPADVAKLPAFPRAAQ